MSILLSSFSEFLSRDRFSHIDESHKHALIEFMSLCEYNGGSPRKVEMIDDGSYGNWNFTFFWNSRSINVRQHSCDEIHIVFYKIKIGVEDDYYLSIELDSLKEHFPSIIEDILEHGK